jgi:hypothetical protein
MASPVLCRARAAADAHGRVAVVAHGLHGAVIQRVLAKVDSGTIARAVAHAQLQDVLGCMRAAPACTTTRCSGPGSGSRS